MNKRVTVESLIKECLRNGIHISRVHLENDELSYEIDGFSKSGTGKLYEEDGKIWLKTRYNQIDEIESFEDIAQVAYEWNKGYCDREPFGWSQSWLEVFKKLGWVETEEITTEIIKPRI